MAVFDEKELKQHIKSKEFSSLYLLQGDEDYLKQVYTNQIVTVNVSDSFMDFNYTRFEGKNLDFRDVDDLAMQFPMMSDKRCIVVDDYKFDGLDDKTLEFIEKTFSNLPETTILIFKQEMQPISKKGSGKKVLSFFEKYGVICNLDKRTGLALYNPLISSAKKQDCILSRKMAEYLVSQVGNEYNVLINELSKICNYVGSGEIKKSHIDTLATKTLETKIYYLTDNLLTGNFDKVYETFDILVKQKTEPEYFLGVIASTFIDMYRVKVAGTYKHSNAELAQTFDYKGRDFVLNKASKNVRYYSLAQLRKAIEILAEADNKLKTSRDNGYLIIEQLMVKLTLLKN